MSEYTKQYNTRNSQLFHFTMRHQPNVGSFDIEVNRHRKRLTRCESKTMIHWLEQIAQSLDLSPIN